MRLAKLLTHQLGTRRVLFTSNKSSHSYFMHEDIKLDQRGGRKPVLLPLLPQPLFCFYRESGTNIMLTVAYFPQLFSLQELTEPPSTTPHRQD